MTVDSSSNRGQKRIAWPAHEPCTKIFSFGAKQAMGATPSREVHTTFIISP